MELFTPLGLAGLVGLALIDSTSFGTLGVPLVMMVRERVNRSALLLYLAVLAVFYLGVGLLLLAGAKVVGAWLSGVGENLTLVYAQAGAGVLLVGISFLIDREGKARLRSWGLLRERPQRRSRWLDAIAGESPSPAAVVGVALGAGLIEVASMVPYLGAIAMLSSARPPWPVATGILVVYVAIMILPALGLLMLRIVFQERIEPLLRRLGHWMDARADDMLGWIVGIVGVLLLFDALQRLTVAGAWPF